MRNKMAVQALTVSRVSDHIAGEQCTCSETKLNPTEKVESVAADWGVDKSVVLKITSGISLLKGPERDAQTALSGIESERMVLNSLLASKSEQAKQNSQIAPLKKRIVELKLGLAGLVQRSADCFAAVKKAEAAYAAASDRFQRLVDLRSGNPQGRKKKELNANFPIAQREKSRSKTELDKAQEALETAKKNEVEHRDRISKLEAKLSTLPSIEANPGSDADIAGIKARITSVDKRWQAAKDKLEACTEAIQRTIECYIFEYFKNRDTELKLRIATTLSRM